MRPALIRTQQHGRNTEGGARGEIISICGERERERERWRRDRGLWAKESSAAAEMRWFVGLRSPKNTQPCDELIGKSQREWTASSGQVSRSIHQAGPGFILFLFFLWWMDGKLCWAMNFFRQRIDHLLLLLLPKMKLLPVVCCCVHTQQSRARSPCAYGCGCPLAWANGRTANWAAQSSQNKKIKGG